MNIWKVAENKFVTLYLHPSSGCIPVGTFFSQNIVHLIYKLRLADLILITMNVQRWPQNCVTVKQSGDLYRWSMQCTEQLHTTRIFFLLFYAHVICLLHAHSIFSALSKQSYKKHYLHNVTDSIHSFYKKGVSIRSFFRPFKDWNENLIYY